MLEIGVRAMAWRTLTGSMGKWGLGLPLLCSVAYMAGLFPLARFKEESVNIVAHPTSIGVNGAATNPSIRIFIASVSFSCLQK